LIRRGIATLRLDDMHLREEIFGGRKKRFFTIGASWPRGRRLRRRRVTTQEGRGWAHGSDGGVVVKRWWWRCKNGADRRSAHRKWHHEPIGGIGWKGLEGGGPFRRRMRGRRLAKVVDRGELEEKAVSRPRGIATASQQGEREPRNQPCPDLG